MAGSFQSSNEDDVIAGINVTPLVDVVLVLLIIFLITAPTIYQSAIKVELPKAKTGEEARKSPLNFTITKQGQIVWDKEPMNWETLSKRLAGLSPLASDQSAMISADQATPHGIVVRLMDALRQIGITRFGLSVETGTPSTETSAGNVAAKK